MKPQEFCLGQLVECSEFTNVVRDKINGYIQRLKFGMLTLRHPCASAFIQQCLPEQGWVPCILFHLLFFFFKYYLFIFLTQREREHKQREQQREREKQAWRHYPLPHTKPRTLGSRPQPKADALPTELPGCPCFIYSY